MKNKDFNRYMERVRISDPQELNDLAHAAYLLLDMTDSHRANTAKHREEDEGTRYRGNRSKEKIRYGRQELLGKIGSSSFGQEREQKPCDHRKKDGNAHLECARHFLFLWGTV